MSGSSRQMSMEVVAAAVARPIVKTGEAKSSWRLTCSDTAWECFAELILYSALLVCVSLAVRRCWNRWARRMTGYRFISRHDASHEVVGLREVEMEEGLGGIVDAEEFGHSGGTCLGPDGLHRTSSAHSIDSYDDMAGRIHVDEYAPPISTLTAWVKEVTPAMNDMKVAVDVAAATAAAKIKAASSTVGHSALQVDSAPSALHSTATDVAGQQQAQQPHSVLSCAVEDASSTGGTSNGAVHCELHKVTLAWSATIGTGAVRTGGCRDSNQDFELTLVELLEAFRVTTSIMELFGSLMAPAVKNDQANLEKVRQAWKKHGQPSTLRGLLQAEIDAKIHRPGGNLKDPSAAIALVWVRRSLAFQAGMLEGLAEDPSATLSAAASEAYKRHLEPHHNFILRNTFRIGLNAMPTKEELMERLAPGDLNSREREAVCNADIRELVDLQGHVLGAVEVLLDQLGLERRASGVEKRAK